MRARDHDRTLPSPSRLRRGVVATVAHHGDVKAAVALGLSGPNSLQAEQAGAGLACWARDQGVALRIEDDRGSSDAAQAAYRGFVTEGVDVLLGPYGSGMVRRVAPVVCEGGRVLWNHGGSADDLARPYLASVVAPASTYFHQALQVVIGQDLSQVVFVHGEGRFGRSVADGGHRLARRLGLRSRTAGRHTWRPEGRLDGAAVFFSARFDDDVELVRVLVQSGRSVGLVGCVAAGIDSFGDRLGDLAEGVVGPAQWFPDDRDPDVGPSGSEFARRFWAANGRWPDYLAAQAAAAGYLGGEAFRRGLNGDGVGRWHTTTMLGPFSLDRDWRQVGYTPVAVRWRGGRRVRALTSGA